MNIKKFFQITLLACFVLSAVMAAVFAANYMINQNNADEGTELVMKNGIVHILLMATDKNNLLTDTIMIASINTNTNAFNILSVPRDTRILIGGKNAKVNAAYASGEEGKRQELAIKKITELTGIPIHYYMVAHPEGFVNIIDILGPVEFNVPIRMEYDDPLQDLHINLKPGLQKLDGNKAEQFCRFRQNNDGTGYPGADLERIKAQQDFIKALIDQKLKPQYILRAGSIFKEISENVKTNIGMGDITTLLPVVKMLNSGNVNTYQLPGNTNGDFICDKAATKKLVDEVFLNTGTE